jgi:hypothetical protein
MSRRKEALCSILGTSEVPASEDYPETITLPTAIHDIMVRAVVKTTEDYRERSVRIGYRHGEWLGGIMMRGPAQKNLIARSNIAHNLAGILVPTQHRPRTPFHSHPVENSIQRLSMAHKAYAWLEKHDIGRALNVSDPASLSNHITYFETSRAQALDPMYVSYASTDIFSSELHKIPVTDMQS